MLLEVSGVLVRALGASVVTLASRLLVSSARLEGVGSVGKFAERGVPRAASSVIPSHCAVTSTSGADLTASGGLADTSSRITSGSSEIDRTSFLSSSMNDLKVDAESRLRMLGCTGSLVVADSNGAPCSGSAKTRDTLAGALFLERDNPLQGDEDEEAVLRGPPAELIEREIMVDKGCVQDVREYRGRDSPRVR